MKNVFKVLVESGLSFDDGILGGVGSGGGGYYDYTSDKISGYNIDKFDKAEFGEWFNGLTLEKLNNVEYDKDDMFDDYEINYLNIVGELGFGLFNIEDAGMNLGCIEVTADGIVLSAYPALINSDGSEWLFIVGVEGGELVFKMEKQEVEDKLKMNMDKAGSWSLI